MSKRKKKLRIIQLTLLIVGTLLIFITYSDKFSFNQKKIVSKENQEKVKKELSKEKSDKDVFYNISYSGLDLAGNRYKLTSKEAYNDKVKEELVNMKSVEAIFYFKDDTILVVKSNKGIYNNRTLDMKFLGNVEANYSGSELFAQNAEYINSESFLIISKNVKVIDSKGSLFADKLIFDIKNQKLDITSFNDKGINANLNLNEKRF